MIRNENEYKEAVAHLDEERNRLAEHRARLKEAGLSDDEIKRVIDPMIGINVQRTEALVRAIVAENNISLKPTNQSPYNRRKG